MTHDPFQTLAMFGAYSGVPTLQPFTGQPNYSPYTPGLNPLAQQQLQQLQQLQLSSILAGQTNPQWQGVSPFHGAGNAGPFQGGQQNPLAGFQQQPFAGYQQQQPQTGLQQNPFIGALQNPFLAAILQNNPMIHPLVAQAIGAQLPYQQAGYGVTPFGQPGIPFSQVPFGQTGMPIGQSGYPLAPQSWIGQTGQVGQFNPLHQLAARAFGTPGIHPWAGY